MSFFRYGIFILLYFLSIQFVSAEGVSTYRSVVKVRSYTYDVFTNTYSSYSEGSAVIVGRDSIITNAHVIMGSDDVPTGFYEICMTGDFISLPKCFFSARLLAYDTEADLALLRPETPISSSLVTSFSQKKIDLASTVNIYGYPAIGGKTITSTSGKIAGFENNVYKLDATIDHGNSGGGAFDGSGKLIGIPFAIRSDNGVIGYMIPKNTILKFLSGSTPDYQKFSLDQRSFSEYLTLQRKISTSRMVSTNGIFLKNPKNYGFHVVGGQISLDRKLSSYTLQSFDKRVTVGYSCDEIFGDQTLADVQEYALTHSPENETSDVITDTYFLGKNQTHFMINMRSNDTTKKGDFSYIYPRLYSDCFASIQSTNTSADKKNIESARSMIVEGTIWKPGTKKISFFDPILSKSQITLPTAFRIHKLPDSLGGVAYVLWYKSKIGNISGGDLHLTSYRTLADIFASIDSGYSMKDRSFENFEKLYSQANNQNTQDRTLQTINGQKFIFSIADRGNEKDISFLYPFQTSSGQYMTLSLVNFTLTGANEQDISAIENFFMSFDFPGTSPFLLKNK